MLGKEKIAVENCRIGSCIAGDSVEMFFVGSPLFFTQWYMIANGNSDHLFNINPAEDGRYLDVFRQVFSELCR